LVLAKRPPVAESALLSNASAARRENRFADPHVRADEGFAGELIRRRTSFAA
jgi:hypothetical protein